MLSAILFDLDGTLANTDPIHFAVWQDILSQYSLTIDTAFFQKHISGKTNAQITCDILPQLSQEQAWQLAVDKEVRYRQLAKILQPMPGLEKILKLTDTASLKRAVVTNAPEENAVHMLENLQLTNVFPLVIMAKDAPPGKPHPAPYMLALERLGVEAQNAIAFEDSPSGITSAVAAGIYTIAITSSHDPNHLLEVGANMAIKDFKSQQLWEFLASKGVIS